MNIRAIAAQVILFSVFNALGLRADDLTFDTLRPYEDPLSPARGLRSADGRFWVNMQGDENFVVYGKNSTPCWGSDTMRLPENNPNADPRVILTENELAIWVRDPRSQRFTKRKVLANRGSGPKFTHLIMQNDGNLVLYDASHNPPHKNGVMFATGEAKYKPCRY